MRPNFSKPIQAFPNFSKEIPSFSKLFPRKFQTFSLAVSNEIKGLSATPGVFALSEPADSNRPRRTAPPVELRFFSLSRPHIFPKTLFFPNTTPRRSRRRRRFTPSPTRRGQANESGRGLGIVALGPRRETPGLDAKTERAQRGVEIGLAAAVVGCGRRRPLRGDSGMPASRPSP